MLWDLSSHTLVNLSVGGITVSYALTKRPYQLEVVMRDINVCALSYGTVCCGSYPEFGGLVASSWEVAKVWENL